jgi:hypothetical protein
MPLKRIRAAQVRASLSVNRELVMLYWNVGRDILNRQRRQGWGEQARVKAMQTWRAQAGHRPECMRT